MKIKRVIQLSKIVSIGMALFLGVFIFMTYQQSSRTLEKCGVAEDIVNGVFELNILTNDYLLHREERTKIQWQLKYNTIARLIEENAFVGQKEQELLNNLRESKESIGLTFSKLLTVETGNSVFEKLEKRLASQLSVKSQAMVHDASRLNEKARGEFVREQQIASLFASIAVLLLILITTLCSYLMADKVAKPIARLEEGAKKIGKGDLKYRIGIKSKDEVGQLAMVFDEMATKLQKSYEDLEEKVKERTAELEMAKNKSEVLLASIGDGVVVIDRSWKITYFNKTAELISGWSSKEAIGKSFREVMKLVFERNREENVSFIEKTMVFGKSHMMENDTVLITKNGKDVPVGDSAAPILNKKGEIVGAIIVFRDKTKEKESDMLKSDFAYASHQLKTPVTKALWSIEVAMKKKSMATIKKSLKDAHVSTESVLKLASELIEVSEIDQGMVTPKKEIVRLFDILEETLKVVKDKAEKNKVSVNVSPVSSLMSIQTDPKLLKRILFEPLKNAIDYNKEGGSVNAEIILQEKDLLIKIQDTGIGITEEQKPLIFTKFFRGSNFDTTSIVGGGLGLYICRKYVMLLGGKIWFESEEKKGTSFFVSLPL